MSSSPALPNFANLSFVESLYSEFTKDPSSVPEEWRQYFFRMGNGNGEPGAAPVRLGPTFHQKSLFGASAARATVREEESLSTQIAGMQDRVDQFVRAYRNRGHMIAKIDPLGLPRPCPPELKMEYYGLTEADLDRVFSCQTIHADGPLTLRAIVQRLHNTYCRSIGVQYMHIDDIVLRRWLRNRMEPTENRLGLSRRRQLRILTRLTDAVVFEEFIRRKFVGAKSFSLEGCESLIPLLDLAIEKAGAQGSREVVLGMAHRGRLNVLANIMGKPPSQIFREFADKDPQRYVGRGDVKYHLGYSTDWKTEAGTNIHLSLCFNPSHLEYVNPVVLGRVRCKQDRLRDGNREKVMALIIHGDAAFAGEGVVQETLNLSQLDGYKVGGALHVIVNNQIGFTTGPKEGRSSPYATDIAKMLQIPVFHVNGEDPEAVAQVVEVAMDFRREFQRDVVIDMYGYRRLGHNEGDEPSFTQPVLYAAVKKRKPVREGYLDHLLALKEVSKEEADALETVRRNHLESALNESQRDEGLQTSFTAAGVWERYAGGPEDPALDCDTGVDAERLRAWLMALSRTPRAFHPHPKILKFLQHRAEMAAGPQPIDWSAAEALALGSLSCEGHPIRFSGQDTARGTFSQRHAVLYDYQKGHEAVVVPLRHLQEGQAEVEILNSPLSEAGVLGYEYGYSLDRPEGLILWEAQFGDFFNAAQVIVDQFLASAEDKWRRLSGLVLMLPHGFEGQGPEHSSARLERFLLLAAEDNLQVVVPSTPAQLFHVLRRQVLRPWRKPLVLFTPKSLLRHPKVVSTLEELSDKRFEPILPDGMTAPAQSVRKVLMCSGKVYYELAEHRETQGIQDVAILRLEQLYPLRRHDLETCLRLYPEGTPVCWVQEEPENMGAWRYVIAQFDHRILFDRFPLSGVCRPASASPATGSHRSHQLEQLDLMNRAFGE